MKNTIAGIAAISLAIYFVAGNFVSLVVMGLYSQKRVILYYVIAVFVAYIGWKVLGKVRNKNRKMFWRGALITFLFSPMFMSYLIVPSALGIIIAIGGAPIEGWSGTLIYSAIVLTLNVGISGLLFWITKTFYIELEKI
jgi:hypothetical protein